MYIWTIPFQIQYESCSDRHLSVRFDLLYTKFSGKAEWNAARYLQISWTDAARTRLHQFSREEQILFPIVKTISEVHVILP